MASTPQGPPREPSRGGPCSREEFCNAVALGDLAEVERLAAAGFTAEELGPDAAALLRSGLLRGPSALFTFFARRGLPEDVFAALLPLACWQAAETGSEAVLGYLFAHGLGAPAHKVVRRVAFWRAAERGRASTLAVLARFELNEAAADAREAVCTLVCGQSRRCAKIAVAAAAALRGDFGLFLLYRRLAGELDAGEMLEVFLEIATHSRQRVEALRDFLEDAANAAAVGAALAAAPTTTADVIAAAGPALLALFAARLAPAVAALTVADWHGVGARWACAGTSACFRELSALSALSAPPVILGASAAAFAGAAAMLAAAPPKVPAPAREPLLAQLAAAGFLVAEHAVTAQAAGALGAGAVGLASQLLAAAGTPAVLTALPDLFAAAAAAGSGAVAVLAERLPKPRPAAAAQAAGAALAITVAAGDIAAAKALLEFSPPLEVLRADGCRLVRDAYRAGFGALARCLGGALSRADLQAADDEVFWTAHARKDGEMLSWLEMRQK